MRLRSWLYPYIIRYLLVITGTGFIDIVLFAVQLLIVISNNACAAGQTCNNTGT
jgi:hypothetical protein